MSADRASKSQSRRRALLTGSAAVLAVLVLVLVWLRRPAADVQEPVRPAVPVEVALVRTMTLQETVRGVGTLRAAAEVVISPETAGRVRAIHFRDGSRVEEGQLLFEFEDDKLQSQLSARRAAVRAAEARLDNARRTFERQEQLATTGVVPREDYERARSELDTAAAELERYYAELVLIEEELKDMSLRAPFSGAISERLVDRGAYVAIGSPLARLYQTDPIEIAFSVPERFLGRVRPGQEVSVTLAAYPGEPFGGSVAYVSPVIDEATRTLSVRAVLPNPKGRLSPGAFATAIVTLSEREDRPVIPVEALVGTRTGFRTFVIEDGIARLREVRTGLRHEGMVEITEGLEPGEQVVRSGHMRLDTGTRVEVAATGSF